MFFFACFRLHRLSPSSPFVCLARCPSYLLLSICLCLAAHLYLLLCFLQLPFVFFALTTHCCSPPLSFFYCIGINVVISPYQGFGNGRRHWEGHWVNLLWMTFKYPSRCCRHQMCYCWLRQVAGGQRFLSGQCWLLSDVPHAAAFKQTFGKSPSM